jgi:hypothetical protein
MPNSCVGVNKLEPADSVCLAAHETCSSGHPPGLPGMKPAEFLKLTLG